MEAGRWEQVCMFLITIVLKMFRQLKQNMDKVKKMMCEQNENINRDKKYKKESMTMPP